MTLVATPLMLDWIRALESGEYRQTNAMLRETDDDGHDLGYCCLGVLADVIVTQDALPFDVSWGEIEDKEVDSDHLGQRDTACRRIETRGASYPGVLEDEGEPDVYDSQNILPRVVAKELGFETAEDQQDFWEANDTHGKTFPEIAMLVREKLGFHFVPAA